MTPEEELGKTLDQLIYDYDACDSPIADLLRELKEARPDARRYRWLRSNWFAFGTIANRNSPIGSQYYFVNTAADMVSLDAAIDAAMETK